MLADGFSMVLTSPSCIGFIFIGVFVGIVFGAIPGLSSTMALVLFLPMTYSMSVVDGLSLLVALYVGGMSGGLISAILLKIPGTPSSMSTVWDGGPMADKGEAGKALGIAILVSFIGTTVGLIAMILLSPQLARVALSFTAYEYFAVALFSLTIIASLAGKDLINGLLSGLLGILLSMIGVTPIDALIRFNFGTHSLDGGLQTVPMLIGLFAIADIFAYGFKRREEQMIPQNFKMRGFGIGIAELLKQAFNIVRACIVGVIVGILPGIGGNTAGIFAYTLAKDSSKHPEEFGTGCVSGLVASETANNAVIGGSMIPMLVLGVPGNTVAAILLGGMTIKGITPGPLIFTKSGEIVYAMYMALLVAAVAMLVFEFFGIRVFVRLLDIPKYILFPIILALCTVGCFGANNKAFDITMMFIIGLGTYILKKVNIPTSPLIIGFILGSMFEENFRRVLTLSKGDPASFLAHPIACVFMLLAVFSLAQAILKNAKMKKANVTVEGGAGEGDEDEQL